MTRRIFHSIVLLVLVGSPIAVVAEPPAAAISAFHSYVEAVETRLTGQHGARDGFLAAANEARLRRGELVVEQVTPAGGVALPGAQLHHWRGTAFAQGATAAEVERVMRDFGGYPKTYAPEVLKAGVLAQRGDRVQAEMRVRQRHVITVVMDTAYDVDFGRLDAEHGYSLSRSTRIGEIEAAGTASERTLGATEEHGFLWRQNTYWSWEERDGGVYLQMESVSLSRSIPRGLGWAVGPFVESVPRESVEFTLRATRAAVGCTSHPSR